MICEINKNKLVIKLSEKLDYLLNNNNINLNDDIMNNIINLNKNLPDGDDELLSLKNLIYSLKYKSDYSTDLFLDNELYNFLEDSLFSVLYSTYQKYLNDKKDNLLNFSILNKFKDLIENDEIDNFIEEYKLLPNQIIEKELDVEIENYYNLIENKQTKNIDEIKFKENFFVSLNDFIKNKLNQLYKTYNKKINPIIIYEDSKYYTPEFNSYILEPNDLLYEIKNPKNIELESLEIYDYYNNNILENIFLIIDNEEIKKDLLEIGNILNDLNIDINNDVIINNQIILLNNIFGYYGKLLKTKNLKLKLNYKIKGIDLFENKKNKEKISKNNNYEIKNIIIKIWKNG